MHHLHHIVLPLSPNIEVCLAWDLFHSTHYHVKLLDYVLRAEVKVRAHVRNWHLYTCAHCYIILAVIIMLAPMHACHT